MSRTLSTRTRTHIQTHTHTHTHTHALFPTTTLTSSQRPGPPVTASGAFVSGLCVCNQHTSVLLALVLVPVALATTMRNDTTSKPRVVTVGLLMQASVGGDDCWVRFMMPCDLVSASAFVFMAVLTSVSVSVSQPLAVLVFLLVSLSL